MDKNTFFEEEEQNAINEQREYQEILDKFPGIDTK